MVIILPRMQRCFHFRGSVSILRIYEFYVLMEKKRSKYYPRRQNFVVDSVGIFLRPNCLRTEKKNDNFRIFAVGLA